MRGKPAPRWSVVRLPVNPALVPLSIAGLPVSNAIVLVGPPLFCKPFASSIGSSGEAIVPVLSVDAVKPVLPSTLPMRLKPADVKAPLTSAGLPTEPTRFKAIMLLLTTVVPVLRMPASSAPLLPLTVLLVIFNLAPLL